MPGARKYRRAMAVIALLVAAGLGLAHYLGSASFQALVKQRVIAELEQATGCRAEIGSLRWNSLRLELFADDLTLQGAEPAGAPPLAHADHVYAQLRVLSLLGARFGLRAVSVEHPVVHLLMGVNGISNLPAPPSIPGAGSGTQKLFAINLERLELNRGELFLNQRSLPLDLNAQQSQLAMTYRASDRSFAGEVTIGALHSRVAGWSTSGASAKASFVLHPNSLDVSSLEWRAGQAQLQARGRISDFSRPQFAGDYQAQADLRQLAGMLGHGVRGRLPSLAGRAEVNGSGIFSASGFSSSGTLALRQAELAAGGMNFSGLEARADFTLDPRQVQFSRMAGSWSGGSFSGQGRIRDWSSAFEPSARNQAKGELQLQFHGLDVERVLRAHRQLATALDGIRLASRADGTVALNWRGGIESSAARFQLSLHPPPAPPAGSLVVGGRIRGAWDPAAQRLELTPANLETPASTLALAGALGHSDSRLEVHLQTANLSELQPLAALLKLPHGPVSMSGQAQVDAVVSGRLRQPAAAGELTLRDFAAEFTASPAAPGAGAAAAARRVHLDRLQSDFALSPVSLAVKHGVMAEAGATADFSLSAGLDDYRFTAALPFSARVTAANASLDELATLAGSRVPVGGRLTIDAQVSGTRAHRSGEARFAITGGRLYGVNLQSLAGSATLRDAEIQSNDLKLVLAGRAATGTARYNLRSRAFAFALGAHNLDLAQVAALEFPRFSVAGRLDAEARGSGTLAQPQLAATLAARDLVLNGEETGTFTLKAATQGRTLELDGRSQFKRGSLTLAGNIQLRDSWPAQIQLKFSQLDVDPALRAYLLGRVTEHSSADGEVTLEGLLGRPASLEVRGQVQRVALDVENLKLASAAPFQFSIRNQVLELQPVHIVGADTDLAAGGRVTLARAGAMDAHADGRLNLRILESFNPSVVSAGMTTLAVSLRGTVAAPVLAGEMKIEEAAISLLDLPTGVSGLNGTLVFNQDRLQIQSLTAQTGGGALALSGYLAYSHGIYFDFTARGDQVRLRYPPGVSATADANLKFTGTLENSLLAGEIRVVKFSVSPDFDFGYYLGKATAPAAVVTPGSVLNTLHFNLHIVTLRQLEVQMSVARLSGNADLRLRGTAARPVLLGRMDISEGAFSFSGTNYHLDRGSISFVNPIRIAPVIDLEASARVRDYDITLTFHGTLDKLSTTYRSDPPLPSGDIIALLALGHTRQDELANTQAQSTLANVATGALLGQALNSAVNSRVQRLFGISRIKIDPIGNPEVTGTTQADRAPTVTVEQQVSNRVTLTYIRNLAQSSQQVIEVEFQVNRNTAVDAIRDQNGVFGMDIKIRQRKR